MVDQSTRQSERRSPEFRPPRTTIRFQLLVTVNSVLAMFVAFFLVYSYRRDLAERLEEKHIALEEEAKTILPAIKQLRHDERQSIQRFIDTVCGRMRDTQSPGHHIAVQLGSDTLQAVAHQRASPEILQAMQRAARSSEHRTPFQHTELVVGADSDEGIVVYVSETLENLRQSVYGNVLRRLANFTVLAIVAAVVVNVALSRIVNRPLQQLVSTVRTIGEGKFGAKSGSFQNVEMNYLAGEINSMSQALAAANRSRKLQMAKAREIQRHLLPKAINIPHLSVAHLFRPADDVGGDYYDIVPLSDGTWLFSIADVTGHGVPAAISAALLKALVLQAAEQLTSPAQMLEFVNHRLAGIHLADNFISMLLLRTTPNDGCFQYASAGHEPGWFIADHQPRELKSTGLLLGLADETSWEDVTIEFSQGDRVLLVTDGVTETFNEREQCFSRRRLADFCAATSHHRIDEMARQLDEALSNFRGSARRCDDVTAVLIEFATPTANRSDRRRTSTVANGHH